MREREILVLAARSADATCRSHFFDPEMSQRPGHAQIWMKEQAANTVEPRGLPPNGPGKGEVRREFAPDGQQSNLAAALMGREAASASDSRLIALDVPCGAHRMLTSPECFAKTHWRRPGLVDPARDVHRHG